MPADVSALVDEIDAVLRSQARPEWAEHEKAYLKSSLQHYGCTVPAIRSAVRAVARRHSGLTHDEVVALAGRLWAEPAHERRVAAVEVLDTHAGLLGRDDVALLERLLRESRTWALVDGLAASVVGKVVERDPGFGPVLDRWATDGDFWIRRSALLALLVPLRKGGGDFERFARYADSMLDEREFFLRKAVGWVLRDTARKRPDMVYEWLLPRASRAAAVTMREAVKPLSEEQRRSILAVRTAS